MAVGLLRNFASGHFWGHGPAGHPWPDGPFRDVVSLQPPEMTTGKANQDRVKANASGVTGNPTRKREKNR